MLSDTSLRQGKSQESWRDNSGVASMRADRKDYAAGATLIEYVQNHIEATFNGERGLEITAETRARECFLVFRKAMVKVVHKMGFSSLIGNFHGQPL